MRKFLLTAIAIIPIAFLFACGGEKQQPEKSTAPQGGQAIPSIGKPVVEVPAAVKGKWKGVVLVIEDKEKKDSKEHPVNIGEKFKVPGSDLTVMVKEFFPSFVMQGSSITSASNEPNNPAAQVVVAEGGSEIFNGWLFAKFPTTHAFSHPKFAIILKEGIAKK
jgi:hypothetical protein